jgi:PKHD-type hydroxylase
MKTEWIINTGYFDKIHCEQFIEVAKKLPVHDSEMVVDGKRITNSQQRKTKIRWIDQTAQTQFIPIYLEFWKFLIDINNDWFGFNITHLPPLQFTEYTGEDKSEYKSHMDTFWLTPTERHRKITVILQLSDPDSYEGGDLILENVTKKPDAIKLRTQGTFIAFPSFFYHKLTPVTSGTRHSLVGWFEGPKFA